MHAEVIAIGDELVTGQRLDTNSRWLSAELAVLGIPVTFHTTAADTLEAGVEAFRVATGRADIVLATGGLGPTADDLTRDVLAALAGTPLEESAEAMAAIEARFQTRKMPCPASNRRQALFPRGSTAIPNPDGTAPGIDLVISDGGRTSRIFALPGVPAEMRPMWAASVSPAILDMMPDVATIQQRRIKCFGAGESAIEEMLPDLVQRGRDPLVGITAHEATITLRIAARGRDKAECAAKIAATEAVIRDCLGTLVFGVGDEELEDAALAAVAEVGGNLATAEVGTAGELATLTAAASARRLADRRAAAFAGAGVLPAAATDDAATLAADARLRFGAACGLAVGGLHDGVEGRPAVTIALASPAGVETVEHVLGGGPALARRRAAKAALDLVRLRVGRAGEVAR
ncbi:MAG: molybdopterin-binding protein [Planctomycetota bacterium]|jgi:nicotinamide-nucleotide amidase|nr:molybdopterin-binding protein [Planctomycetota bacterium]